MPVTERIPMTIEALTKFVLGLESMKLKRRKEMASALKRLSEVAGVDRHSTLADPGVFRKLFASPKWRQQGMSKGRWANIRSLANEALELAGIDVHRARTNYAVAPEWQLIIDKLPVTVARDLRRFAGWCSGLRIDPAAVDTAVFDRFRGYCTDQMTHRNPRERWHTARRAWNRAIDEGVLVGAARVGCPEAEAWRALTWSEFPGTLKQDFDAFVAARCKPQLFAKAGGKPLRAKTVENYGVKVRVLATCLVEAGRLPSEFADLVALITPQNVEDGLQHYVRDDNPSDAMARVSSVGIAVRSMARWLLGSSRIPEHEFSKVIDLCNQVVHRPKGMCARNRDRLAPFADPSVAACLVNLPYEVLARLDKRGQPTVRDAQDAQMAALLCFLLHLPVRIKNASQVDLAKHVSRFSSEAGGIWLVRWTEDEVKNHLVLDHRLAPEPCRLLERFCEAYRPVLLKGPPTSRLFVGQTGRPLGAHELSSRLAKFVVRETGLEIHAHLIRHLMAYLYLKANPGEYVTVQRLLGHKSVQTTIDFYTGFEVDSDFERYDDLILKIRSGSTGSSLSEIDRL